MGDELSFAMRKVACVGLRQLEVKRRWASRNREARRPGLQSETAGNTADT